MTFTKTSQKFGQWSDARANTVFGLGFPSEAELNKVGKPISSYIYNLIPRVSPPPPGKERDPEVKVYYASHS